MTKYIDRYYLNGELYGIKFDEGGGGYEPNEHTLLWLPFKEDLLDHSGNNIQLIQGGTNLSIVNGVAEFDGGYLYRDSSYGLSQLPATINVYVKPYQVQTSEEFCILNSNKVDYGSYMGWSFIIAYNTQFRLETLPGSSVFNGTTINANERYLLTAVLKTTGSELYLNGQYVGTTDPGITLQDRIGIGGSFWSLQDLGQQLFSGCISEIIIEDKARTAQEISDYFDQTKSLYGIS